MNEIKIPDYNKAILKIACELEDIKALLHTILTTMENHIQEKEIDTPNGRKGLKRN